MLQLRYSDNIHYPQKAYVQALERMIYLRHIRSLVIEIMVGHRPALLAEAGYRYDTRHTSGSLGIILDIRESKRRHERNAVAKFDSR